VVVLEIDIENIARGAVLEAESQPSVAADRHREGSSPGTLKLMKPANSAQISYAGRAVDRVEHQAHAFVKFRPDTAGLPGKEDLFRAFVRERFDAHNEILLIGALI
jgi:hypothetical protein